jgi:cytochrome b subunit of formate dehydrogenase/nitrate/TMAO reductase-like tetraheme cytochrome c subunit
MDMNIIKSKNITQNMTIIKYCSIFQIFLLIFKLGTVFAAEKITNEDCLDCHSEKQVKKVQGKDVPLLPFPTNEFNKSVHSKILCIDCHNGIKEAIHDPNPPPPQCSECHPEQKTHKNAFDEYTKSIHGASRSMGASAAAACWDCHGAHEIVPVKSIESPVFKLNLPTTCGKCHSNPEITAEYKMRYPNVTAQYRDSIHGRGLLEMGLIVAPSCNDCHGVHNIKRVVDRSSPINPANVSKTCGKCHVKVEEIYNNSVHGKLLAKGDKRAPTCNDCHTAHEIEPPRNGHFKMVSDQRCGKCHQDRLRYYHETYHGKAMQLGKPNLAPDVAACYDCHGHHDVLPPSDPKSRLSPSNIVQTCKQCHPKANAGFTQYLAHANPLDKKNYPQLYAVFVFMTSLLVGVFVFFGAHTLFWLFRSAYLYITDSKTFREAKVSAQKDDEWFTRFAPFERFLHILVVTSFLLLVLTGMPLKFYYADWAKTIFRILGGPDVARALHRFGAIITFTYFGLHLIELAVYAWRNRGVVKDPQTGKFQIKRVIKIIFGPDSMIPTIQDWRDFIAHNKWFFGKSPKPQFDRWTYWEKFDYFAVFWGVFMIGMSGLIMWVPEFFTKFLPGWIINIAHIIHSDEALLAAGFIFTIHFFNTHFRLEKFPMDTVIFSGRISKTEMLHERKRWYDRLVAEGRLDEFRVKDEWHRWKGIARTFGYIFFTTGVILLLLIIYAMISRLITH